MRALIAAMTPEEAKAMADPILIAKAEHDLCLLPQMANRHGLVAGATGTGKTVTLQVLAEGFSRIGRAGVRSPT